MPKANTGNKLDDLSRALIEAKDNATAWTKEKNRLEGEIANVVGVKDEGTTSIETDEHKVKTVGKINRTVSQKDALALRDEIDEAAYKRLFGWKPTLLIKELHWLQENEPATYEKVLGRITSKAAKVAVSVEPLE